MAKPGTFQKGADARRAPGGFSPERLDLRRRLEGDAEEIHTALMQAVREGNVPAIIYAHTQLLGKPRERVEVNDTTAATWMGKLTPAQVLAIARGEKPEDE